MDIDKVRGLTDAELVTELSAAKRNLYDLRFQLATRQLTDYSQIPQTRKKIARILTVMTERRLSEAPTAPASDGNGSGEDAAAAEPQRRRPRRAAAATGGER